MAGKSPPRIPKPPTDLPHDQTALNALCKAYWWFKTYDQIELARLNNGLMAQGYVERIIRVYSVSRTIPLNSPQADLPHPYVQLAETLYGLAGNWHGNLVQKAGLCVGGADGLNLGSSPRSAVSKLMWYLQPNGWALYDSFAALGAGLNGIPSQANFLRFYAKLHEADFGEISATIRSALTSLTIACLR